MAMAPSSPRLPSPPPAAEDQIGPQSPSVGAQTNRQTTQMEQTLINANAKRRVHPGTKAHDMAAGPPLVPLNELDSAFQLQEHLAALHYHHSNSGRQAITRSTAVQLSTPPPSIDRTLWLYELCRLLVSQCNTLIVGFLFDSPPCSAGTCPEMRASEWQFLCAVHEHPKSCCAIDYCCHTLDWAANIVTDPQIFPSRFVVSSDAQAKALAVKNLVNVFRRLHRIFAHAWFQHRAVFWDIEGRAGLYVFFKTVCDMYDLLPAENYKLPPEAEGLEPAPGEKEKEREKGKGGGESGGGKSVPGVIDGRPLSIAKPPSRQQQPQHHQHQHQAQQSQQEDDNNNNNKKSATAPEENYQSIGRTNTRRHIRASPSTGSAVTTVMETDEEEAGDVTNKMKELSISAPQTVEEESEVEVPVIVEQDVIADASPKLKGQGEENGGKETKLPDADATVQQEASAPEGEGEGEAGGPGPEKETETEKKEELQEETGESKAVEEPKPEAEVEAGADAPASEFKDETAGPAGDEAAEEDGDEGDATIVENISGQEEENPNASAELEPQDASRPENKPAGTGELVSEVESEKAEEGKEGEESQEKKVEAAPDPSEDLKDAKAEEEEVAAATPAKDA